MNNFELPTNPPPHVIPFLACARIHFIVHTQKMDHPTLPKATLDILVYPHTYTSRSLFFFGFKPFCMRQNQQQLNSGNATLLRVAFRTFRSLRSWRYCWVFKCSLASGFAATTSGAAASGLGRRSCISASPPQATRGCAARCCLLVSTYTTIPPATQAKPSANEPFLIPLQIIYLLILPSITRTPDNSNPLSISHEGSIYRHSTVSTMTWSTFRNSVSIILTSTNMQEVGNTEI